jgi:hypothetical protein
VRAQVQAADGPGGAADQQQAGQGVPCGGDGRAAGVCSSIPCCMGSGKLWQGLNCDTLLHFGLALLDKRDRQQMK